MPLFILFKGGSFPILDGGFVVAGDKLLAVWPIELFPPSARIKIESAAAFAFFFA